MDIEDVVATIVRDHKVDRILEHHGIKGMKWGVRRDRSMSSPGTKRDIRREQNPNLARAELRIGGTRQDFKDARKDAKWLKKTHGANLARGRLVGRTSEAVSREAQKNMKPEIKALNKKPEYSSKQAKKELKKNKNAYQPDPVKYPIAAKYRKDVSNIYMKNVKAAAAKHMQTSPSGKWQDEFQEGKDYWYIGIKQTDKVSHSNLSDPDVAMFVRPVFDEEGYIVDFEFLDSLQGVTDSMAQSTDAIVQDILEHHGVKGMKWGVRKGSSSNSSGSGLHAVSSQTVRSIQRRRAQSRSSEVTVIDKGKKLKTRGGKGLPAHPDAIRAREIGQRGKGSGLKTLSDAELKTYANRLQLEQNVHRLNYNEQNAGKRFVANLLKRQGSRAAQAGADTAGSMAAAKVIKRSAKLAALAAA